MTVPAADLDKAIDAVRRHSWSDAYELFSEVDASTLTPEQVEAKADAAWWTSRLDESMALRRQAIRGFIDAGDNRRAAYAEWFLSADHLFLGEYSVASGLLMRARRRLANEPECVERGFILLADADAAKESGDLTRAGELAEEVIELGQSCASPDILEMGVQTLGRVKVAQGATAEGMELLDEAMSAVIAGELGPVVTGWVYCQVLNTCLEVADLRRAAEWTEALTTWCETSHPGSPYHGICRVYRVEIETLRGAWAEAEADAERCSVDLMTIAPGYAAEAFYAIGEIQRRRGELERAEDSFMRAHEVGRDPQPGLALLRLAQGKAQAAAAALRVALSSGSGNYLQRARLLAAQVETTLALGDMTTASIATEELSQIADDWGSTIFHAIAVSARASLELAREDLGTWASARQAWSLWQQLKVPHEAARARILVGLASRLAGDEEGARLEIAAARSSLERLGARLDAERAANLLRSQARLPRGLSRRELEILRLVASGKTNREIASEMVISEHTVSRHLQNIFTKLDVSSRAAATAFAFENQLI